MEYVYAALLLHQAKKPITEENLAKVLESVDITPNQSKIKALIASLEGQNIDEVLKQAPTVAAPAQETKKEEEEKKEEKKAEEAVAGLSSLFG